MGTTGCLRRLHEFRNPAANRQRVSFVDPRGARSCWARVARHARRRQGCYFLAEAGLRRCCGQVFEAKARRA
eukprot:11161462-Lingulodinium_polyedra.AAC.1